MSIFPGFISAYQKRELAFDKTYYDLCLALDASPLRQPLFKHEAYILEPLYEIIHGKVYREGRGFYVDLPDAKKLDANIVAEGLRKIATLIYLVKNGSIAPNSILLLDEPEANLNPKLVPKMLEFLRRLTGEGVQIFLATHDYLVAHELSLHAEYVEDDTSRFFSFYRQENGDGGAVEVGDTLVDIDHNPILDEYAAHHERETALFYKHAPQTETA
ncbi:MAG TPA: ATP-binding protein [Anaerolineae bacterium]|nr:ATP-binding protein [Anaerolineae bacterium]